MTAAARANSETALSRAEFISRHHRQLADLLREHPELRCPAPPEPVTRFVPLADPRELFAPIRDAVQSGVFRVRSPAPSPQGLVGPFVGRGECLAPLLPGDRLVLAWFDPMPARDGDVVLVAHDAEFLADLVERGRQVPGWLAEYGEQPSALAVKVLRHCHGHHLLLTNGSSTWLADRRFRHRVLGVLRYVEIDGRPVYGCGLGRASRPTLRALPTAQIDYASGATVESLEPAEAAADVTAPRILGNGLLNPSAETGTLEGWTAVTGTWSVDDVEPRAGTFHLRGVGAPAAARIRNDSSLQVEEGDRVLAMGFVQGSGSGAADTRVQIVFRDAAGAIVTSAAGNARTGVDYELSRVIAGAPATAVVAEFEFELENSTGRIIYADGAYMQIIPRGADIILDEASGTVHTVQIADEAVTTIASTSDDTATLANGGSALVTNIPSQGTDYSLQLICTFDAWKSGPGSHRASLEAGHGGGFERGQECEIFATSSPGQRVALQLEFPMTVALGDVDAYMRHDADFIDGTEMLECRNLTLRAEAVKR